MKNICLTILLLVTAARTHAVLSSTVAWNIRQTASAGNTNGGGFNVTASGTDWSQQDAAQYNLSAVTTAGADGTLLSASAATDMVGNIAHIISGVNFTAGWYEIISVVAGVSITLDRTAATAAGSAGVVNIGGALSMGSTLDDDVFEVFVAGNVVNLKSTATAPTLGEAISVASTSATVTSNIHWIGYNTTTNDAPTGTSRPTFNIAASSIALAANWSVRDIIFTGNSASLLTLSSDSRLRNSKVINTSSSANRTALTIGAGTIVQNCEMVSLNGTALAGGGASSILVHGNYIHDSDLGFVVGVGAAVTTAFNIFEDCKTSCYTTTATSARQWVINNTFHGANTTPIGIGARTTGTNAAAFRLYNNIFNGLAVGIEIATIQQDGISEDYNDFFNNTTDRTRCSTGTHSVTNSPAFAGATQITGTTGSSNGTLFTQSGGDFSSVTDNVDILRIVSGTGGGGVAVANYLVTGHSGTTLTVNNSISASGSNADIVYVLMTGHNFLPTGPL